jgi:anti-sigma B factor antagonist
MNVTHLEWIAMNPGHTAARPGSQSFMSPAGGESDPLHIETEERPEGFVAYVSGEVDLANVVRLKDAIHPVLTNRRNVILDVSNLRYIGSTGLRVIIDTNTELQQNNCQLVIAGASPGIAKVMRILHLDRRLSLTSSVEEAMSLIRLKSSATEADE